MNKHVNINTLLGKVLYRVTLSPEHDRIEFACTDGTAFVMCHFQDCCELVLVKEIVGDMSDIYGRGLPITLAEEWTNDTEQLGTDGADRFLWTFYKLGTLYGCVTITWLGVSNGYYSEAVDFVQTS
jgi:hypothetical protein